LAGAKTRERRLSTGLIHGVATVLLLSMLSKPKLPFKSTSTENLSRLLLRVWPFPTVCSGDIHTAPFRTTYALCRVRVANRVVTGNQVTATLKARPVELCEALVTSQSHRNR
jgi:hypothetical protein